MRNMKVILMMGLISFTVLIFYPWNSSAYELLGGRLSLRGNIQQTANYMEKNDPNRDYRLGSFRTMVRGEGVLKAVNCPDYTVDLHVLGNYYYDEALDLESGLSQAIRDEAGGKYYGNFQRPRDYNEWLTEFYLDMKYQGWFQLKLGKQLVSWGQTAEAQVADLINPLALQYILAFPDWEDYKLGLWMARLYLTPPNMWQDLSFEFLFIPQYLASRYPPAGTSLFYGSGVDPTLQPILNKQRNDAPKEFRFDDMELGIRIRGKSKIGEGVDWTLSNFNTRADMGIINGQKGFNNLLVGTILDLPLKAFRGKAFTYPRYNSTALTFATTWNRIGAAIRGECTYNSRVDYQFGTYDIKERDLLTTALSIRRATMVPFISEWNYSRSIGIAVTYYNYKLMNHKKGIVWDSYDNNSYLNKISLQMDTGFLYDTILPFVYTSTNLNNGSNVIVGGVTYQPGDHWQWTFTYQHLEDGVGRYQSQAVFSARYEFW
jgi:hypothetical protein